MSIQNHIAALEEAHGTSADCDGDRWHFTNRAAAMTLAERDGHVSCSVMYLTQDDGSRRRLAYRDIDRIGPAGALELARDQRQLHDDLLAAGGSTAAAGDTIARLASQPYGNGADANPWLTGEPGEPIRWITLATLRRMIHAASVRTTRHDGAPAFEVCWMSHAVLAIPDEGTASVELLVRQSLPGGQRMNVQAASRGLHVDQLGAIAVLLGLDAAALVDQLGARNVTSGKSRTTNALRALKGATLGRAGTNARDIFATIVHWLDPTMAADSTALHSPLFGPVLAHRAKVAFIARSGANATTQEPSLALLHVATGREPLHLGWGELAVRGDRGEMRFVVHEGLARGRLAMLGAAGRLTVADAATEDLMLRSTAWVLRALDVLGPNGTHLDVLIYDMTELVAALVRSSADPAVRDILTRRPDRGLL